MTAGACLFAFSASAAAPRTRVTATNDGISRVKAAVRRAFGSGVEVAGAFQPCFLTGDFNGDGVNDLAAIVRVKSPAALGTRVRVVNPWHPGRKAAGASAGLALAILHGGRSGVNGSPVGRYLITDREFFDTPIWQAAAPKDLVGVVRKPRATARGRQMLPRPARGDAIRVATEAGIDTLLYWDGETYRLYSPPEEP